MTDELPTFDEWFEEKYGETFEACYVVDGILANSVHRAVWRHGAEYLSDMVKRIAAAP